MGVSSATFEGHARLSPLAIRQISWSGLGLFSMMFAFAVDYRELERLGYFFYAITLLLLLLVPILGSFGGGARRWINWAPFRCSRQN